MWSAVLGLAGSAFGALQQSQIAQQMVQQQYQSKQMEMQELQLGMAARNANWRKITPMTVKLSR